MYTTTRELLIEGARYQFRKLENPPENHCTAIKRCFLLFHFVRFHARCLLERPAGAAGLAPEITF